MQEIVNFTDNAALKVTELIQDEGNFNLKLRVFITGGGCSGFQYGFTFDEEINDDDTVIEKNVSTILVQNDEDESDCSPGFLRDRGYDI